MAWGAVIAAAAAMVGKAVVSGVNAYNATQDKIKAYRGAAEDIKKATELYSGTNLNNAMTEKGMANAAERNAQSMGAAANNFNGTGSTKMVNFMPLKQNVIDADRTSSAYNAGANRVKTEADAKFNAEKQKADLAKEQADINYNVKNKAGQAIANGIGNLSDLTSQFGGWGKKGNNNNNGKGNNIK